jgi:protein CLEC16A
MIGAPLFSHPYSLSNGKTETYILLYDFSESGVHILGFAFFQPRIDEKQVKWLHLCIRPSTVPFLDPEKYKGKTRRYLVDGRWTLAFGDEQSCKTAETMVIEEIKLQQNAIGKQLKPLVEFEITEDGLQNRQTLHETASDDGS